MNGYELHRSWFDFAFENQGKVSPAHGIIYLWNVELNNRMGWVRNFASPASQAMAAAGIKSYNTYKKVFDNLVEWGFIEVVTESKNQYTACIIALSKNDKALDKALDKAITTHRTTQCKSIDSIIKPINEETNKPSFDESDTQFHEWWDAYGKKVDRVKTKKAWDKLSKQDKEKCIKATPHYVASRPDRQFRKNPLSYLNGQCWLDEVELPQSDVSPKPLTLNDKLRARAAGTTVH